MAEHQEIERRFLARATPQALAGAARQRLRQGYLTDGEPSVRVRCIDGRWILTVKSGSGRVRREVEADLPPATGDALLQMATSAVLEKTRCRLGRWEVDVYEGELRGIVIAECELARPEEPVPAPPEGLVLLGEVTERLTAHALARLPPREAHTLVARLLDDVEEGGDA